MLSGGSRSLQLDAVADGFALTISELFLTINAADLCGLRLSLIAPNFKSSSICILNSSISFGVDSMGYVLII